eukprot:364988-Chlamydomonas_euryale.AAC.20
MLTKDRPSSPKPDPGHGPAVVPRNRCAAGGAQVWICVGKDLEVTECANADRRQCDSMIIPPMPTSAILGEQDAGSATP